MEDLIESSLVIKLELRSCKVKKKKSSASWLALFQ